MGSPRCKRLRGALELQEIYNSLGLYSELQTSFFPTKTGHGAWNGEVDGKGLFRLIRVRGRATNLELNRGPLLGTYHCRGC